ncbi:MAG: preprotein translocase subunit YajC [Mariniphaga sp.]|jgi:preprotein translocase subunit YajC|nr:preprotein translocase subunit YajC [Mariniphaga sp.]
MSSILFIVAQAPAGGASSVNMLLMMGLMIVVFYFFMIRPQMKRQKEMTKFRSALQKGDKIVTTGGIYGKIDEIKDNIIILEVAMNVKLKVDKSVVLKDMSDAPVQK